MAKMEMSEEAVATIRDWMAVARLKVKLSNNYTRGDIISIVAYSDTPGDTMGVILFDPDFDGKIAFRPNGDWFGLEVERMGE